MGRSPHGLLEARIAAAADDHDCVVGQRPDHVPADRRLPGEQAVAVPRWRLERVPAK